MRLKRRGAEASFQKLAICVSAGVRDVVVVVPSPPRAATSARSALNAGVPTAFGAGARNWSGAVIVKGFTRPQNAPCARGSAVIASGAHWPSPPAMSTAV